MYRRIVLMGAGFTGCDLLIFAQTSMAMQTSVDEIATVCSKLRHAMDHVEKDIQELKIMLEGIPPLSWPVQAEHRKEKKPKYIRQQHKYAMRYHGRRK